MSWHAGPFLGFDTETTGVDVHHDRIVTAALVRRDVSGTHVRTWLIDPGVEIPAEAAAIHGVSTERARAQGLAPARALEEIAEELCQAQHDGVPVVAYNAAFDLMLLDNELVRHGLRTLPDRLGRDCKPVLDPLVLDWGLDRFRPGRRTLQDLCGHYAVADQANLHTAEVDVVATLDVLARIAAQYPEITSVGLAALHTRQEAMHRDWAEDVNARRASNGLTGPRIEAGWPRPLEPVTAGTADLRHTVVPHAAEPAVTSSAAADEPHLAVAAGAGHRPG